MQKRPDEGSPRAARIGLYGGWRIAMTDDLDLLLARLANVPMPAGLADISDSVFARIKSDALAARAGTRIGMAAIISALLLGVTAAMTFSSAAPAAPLSPIGISAGLAPSTLLDGGQ